MLTNLEPGSSRKMKKCPRRKTRKLRKRKMKQQNIEESRKDVTDLEVDEDRPRSQLKRTKEQMQKWHRPSRVITRNDRLHKGVKPSRFRKV